MVAAVKSEMTVVCGKWGGVQVELMLDSGSAVSLARRDVLAKTKNFATVGAAKLLKLVTASGDDLPIMGYVRARVEIGELNILHNFVVVENLVAPVILGVDFLHANSLVLDFARFPIMIRQATSQPTQPQRQLVVEPLWEAERNVQGKACAIRAYDEFQTDMVEECAVPQYEQPPQIELPECNKPCFLSVLNTYQHLFHTKPGVTDAAYHFIPTMGSPVRVPPRRVPAQYREEVQKQISSMLKEQIIRESSSPWMAPAVFVTKKSGELRLCIDYRELNKKTTKDAYPLPLPDEVQDRLSRSIVFSTLDLQSGYWQLPVNPADREKTAFCPGPGMGLYEFQRMPFGLSGAPSSFQRLMDKVLRGLPFVTIYLDDILIHSRSEEAHKKHLEEVFKRLTEAGLTLRGRKCHIGMTSVQYLGHVFSGEGMTPDPGKVQVVQNWPVPRNSIEVCQFLGLASYYRRYIQNFSEIAAPLHALTRKDTPFTWTKDCMTAFATLKERLTQAPVLTYPRFDNNAEEFVLQTDASAGGLGVVLEQGGHVIAYASRSLTSPERSYSVIQRECLAIIFALKQFRQLLTGTKIPTSHGSCSSAVAFCTKDGWYVVSLGIGHARV